MSVVSAEAEAETLLALMADSTGCEMVTLMFGNEPVPMQLVAAKLWSRVLTSAIDAERGLDGSKSSDKTVIPVPMDCKKDDWLLAMSFCYPVRPPPKVTWTNLEPLMKIAHKYDMPAIMDRCEEFLMSNVEAFNSQPSSQQFGWKWITLADAANGQGHLAKACFEAKRFDRSFALAFSDNEDILNSLSPELSRHISMTYAKQQVGLGQLHCKRCRCATDLLEFQRTVPIPKTSDYTYRVVKCAKCRSEDLATH